MKTIFYNGITQIKAEFLNAINNPVYREAPSRDGELPLITDDDLSGASGQLKPAWKEFTDAFKISVSSGLTAAYGGGVFRVGSGSPQILNPGLIALPDNSLVYVYLNTSGQIAQGTDYPTTGKVLAQVTTQAGKISQIQDFRARGILEISSATLQDTKLIGSIEPMHGAPPSSGFIEQRGLRWVSLVNDAIRSIGAPGSNSNLSYDWLKALYLFLWNDATLTWKTSSGTAANRPTSGQSGWDSKLQLALPDYRDQMLYGVSSSATFSTERGARSLTLTQSNLPNVNFSVTDPGHAHSVYDPTHTHSAADSGHNHSVYDPSHLHPYYYHAPENPVSSTYAIATTSDSRYWTTRTYFYPNTSYAGTGIGLYASVANIAVSGKATGISLYAASTNISVKSGGSGSALDITPKSKGVTWLMFAG